MYHALLPKTDDRDKGRGHDRRLGTGQMRLHSSCNIVGATQAHYTWFPWSVQSLMGCILPTTHRKSQLCWELLHLFARSLTSLSLRTHDITVSD